MKRSEIFFDAVLVPLDLVAILVASILTYIIRVSPTLNAIRPALFRFDLPLRQFVFLVAVVGILTIVIFGILGLYSMGSTRRGFEEFTRICAGATLSVATVIGWMFFRAELFQSRFLLVAAWLASILLVTIFRRVVRYIQIRLFEKGVGAHLVVLVGDTVVAEQLKKRFLNEKRIGYKVIAHLRHVDEKKLNALHDKHLIDEIIQCDPYLDEKETFTLMDFCEDYKIEYKYVPNLYSTRTSNVITRTLAGYPLVELRRTPLDGWGRVIKRAFDLFGAILGIILLSPFLALVGFIIAWDSTGPIFFKQKRIGKNKKIFRIVKFRTMISDAEKQKKELMSQNERSGPLFKMRNDPRITRIGRILRKYRIDEVPQLWNVLRNEMSLIGPRPHLPEEIAQYRKEHRRLFTIKPGMTGLAQASGSSELSFEDEATMDTQYIEQWNMKLDLQIFFRTLWKLLWDRTAV
ncbi:MAG: sugar transferase [bacterium]|nr:sugar transferase [bacterium]